MRLSLSIVLKSCSVLFVTVTSITGFASAQSTTMKLSTTDDTSSFDVTKSDDASVMTVQADGKVGINQASPSTNLHVGGTEGLLVTGTFGSGTAMNPGAGMRLHWYPRKGAFRSGYIDGSHWNDGNIGNYSFASGYATTASKHASTALGNNTIASDVSSTAMGYATTASGVASTAIGNTTTASGHTSMAMGQETTASGMASTAMGYTTIASGNVSTAIGNHSTASGYASTAIGNYASTNSKGGSFVIGDNSTSTTMNCDTDNQMLMRFEGGYKLYSNSALSAGVLLNPGGSSWSSVSDSTKKENYLPVDGEAFLESLSQLRLGSWNYKGQNPAEHRHYGPMAQEIFLHYGRDDFGVVGCDTLLASADMDGIMMICLKALEKRTRELAEANERITSLEEANERITSLEETIREQGVANALQDKAIASLHEMLAEVSEELKSVKTMAAVAHVDRREMAE